MWTYIGNKTNISLKDQKKILHNGIFPSDVFKFMWTNNFSTFSFIICKIFSFQSQMNINHYRYFWFQEKIINEVLLFFPKIYV